ncbi:hypothetical protein [Microbacterium sp.]|uniref:hypothetical protein n=1 Tax=Microbacterium sp. TaxID=51671 RepID=UPI0032218C03
MVVLPDAVIVAILSVFLFLALCAALVLVTISVRRPANVPLLAAGAIVVLCLMVVAVAAHNVPSIVAMALALLATALAVVGGNPVTRRILDIATRGTTREGVSGGILVAMHDDGTGDTKAGEVREVLRGGTTIGYLERLAVALAIVAGYPEAIAVVVAIKGIGRFSELDTAPVRERFIVGTLASLLWACAVAAIVRLAAW